MSSIGRASIQIIACGATCSASARYSRLMLAAASVVSTTRTERVASSSARPHRPGPRWSSQPSASGNGQLRGKGAA
eukprot:8179714-Alexandrium_andersonii.AAC.1